MTTGRFLNTGEGSAARRDTSSAAGGPDWIQEVLFPPTLIEIDMRVRVAVATDTAQIQIELSDPVTKELLAMRSRPPHHIDNAHAPLTEAWAWIVQALDVLLNPEPF